MQGCLFGWVYSLRMAPPRRSDRELAARGRRSARRYRLILLNKARETAAVDTERELGLGDHVDVRGRPYEVVGLVWKRSRQYLLCRPTPGSCTADEPVGKEKTWWSAEWR